MSHHRNADVIRGMTEAMSSGDMQSMAAALADDVVWHEIGNPEPVRGKAALAARFSVGGPDYQITAVLHDVVSGGDHTIALVTATATRDGKTLTYRTAEIFHMKNDKVVERWAFSDDTDAINKFFA
jgi:ketosteroid isomerase-like protein